MTIFASFNLPPMVSSVLSSQFGISKLYADVSAQLISPCAIQALSTPLHLLGMDLYNQPVSTTATRVSFIQREYLATTAARMGRIFPAFGIGGVANKLFKKHSREFLARWRRAQDWNALLCSNLFRRRRGVGGFLGSELIWIWQIIKLELWNTSYPRSYSLPRECNSSFVLDSSLNATSPPVATAALVTTVKTEMNGIFAKALRKCSPKGMMLSVGKENRGWLLSVYCVWYSSLHLCDL